MACTVHSGSGILPIAPSLLEAEGDFELSGVSQHERTGLLSSSSQLQNFRCRAKEFGRFAQAALGAFKGLSDCHRKKFQTLSPFSNNKNYEPLPQRGLASL